MELFFNQIDRYLTEAPYLALMAVFLAGVFTSFTPCVYPVIPVVIGVIGAKASSSRRRAFRLSLTYVLGMALTYSGLGIVAALSGQLFGEISTQPFAYLLVANICIFFGLAMMGVFEIRMPQFSFFRSSQPGKGSFWDVFLVGLGSGFVLAPCTVPVLGILLTFAASGANPLFGFLLLFIFSLGLGFLLVLIGTFTGLISSLPKSGPWQLRIKKGFGFFMILVGEYFLVRMGMLLI